MIGTKPWLQWPDFYVQEVTAEETGCVRKILLIGSVEVEMTRCVSLSCNKDDHPMEKHHVTLGSPGTSRG
jgi:hypothetical protein